MIAVVARDPWDVQLVRQPVHAALRAHPPPTGRVERLDHRLQVVLQARVTRLRSMLGVWGSASDARAMGRTDRVTRAHRLGGTCETIG